MLRFMSCVDVPCEKPFLNLRSHIFELDGDYFPSQRLVDNDRKQFLWVLLRSLIEPRAINKSHFHHNLTAVRAEEAEGSLTTLRLLRSCAWKRSFYRFSRRPLHRPLVSHHHWQWTAPTWAKNVSAIQRHGGSKQKTEWNSIDFLTIFMFPSPLDVYTNKMDFLRPPLSDRKLKKETQ